MEAFLTVIVVIFVGFWVFGKISRWLLKYWIIKKQGQFARQFGGQFGSAAGSARSGRGSSKPRPEGEVVITNSEIQSDYTVNKSTGEYVQYEEVQQNQGEDKTAS